MALTTFEIGATYAGRVNVEDMTTMPSMQPVARYYAYAESIPVIDGSRKTRGSVVATWTWGFIPLDMFTALRAICTGGSVSVIIRTTGADNLTFGYYSAVMVWPELDGYEYRVKDYLSFELRFEKLTVYTP